MNIIELNKNQTISEIDSFTVERYLQFSNYINSNVSSILDIGCNTGRGGVELKKKFPKVKLIGLDLVEDRLKKIPSGIYENLICNEGHNTGLESNSIDIIVAGEVIEHIEKSKIESTLKEFYRILKPSGLLLTTTPNPNSLLVKLGRNSVFNDPSHVNIMSIKQCEIFLKNAGFNNVKSLGSGKATRYISEKIPLMFLFGSYLSISKK